MDVLFGDKTSRCRFNIIKQCYVATDWKTWLTQNNLLDFEALWLLETQQVDEGNTSSRGWSRVGRYEHDGKAFYIKKQENYTRLNPSSFFQQVPTAKFEFDKIAWYQENNIPCLKVVYYAHRKAGRQDQAILITEALDDYQALDIAFQNSPSVGDRRQLAMSLGKSVAALHNCGIIHSNLYPKHIYVKKLDHEGFHVRFIDLENSRAHYGLDLLKRRDLDQLARHAEFASRTQMLSTFLSYVGKRRLDTDTKKRIRSILKRMQRKNIRHHLNAKKRLSDSAD